LNPTRSHASTALGSSPARTGNRSYANPTLAQRNALLGAGTAAASLDTLQAQLGYRFTDPALLARAMTHRSFGSQHNERLEFLGDAVLNAAVGHLLFETLDTLPEGDLSRVRANLVRQETLHQLALGLHLSPLLRLGEGEARSGGAQRASILADALEALIGAVYLDGGPQGYNHALCLVQQLFKDVEFTPQMAAMGKDPKTQLQEWLQGRRQPVPNYIVTKTEGKAHQQSFEVQCSVPGFGLNALGSGQSRKAAEQAAAQELLGLVAARGL
jgi:ribonuclease III